GSRDSRSLIAACRDVDRSGAARVQPSQPRHRHAEERCVGWITPELVEEDVASSRTGSPIGLSDAQSERFCCCRALDDEAYPGSDEPRVRRAEEDLLHTVARDSPLEFALEPRDFRAMPGELFLDRPRSVELEHLEQREPRGDAERHARNGEQVA